MYVPFVAWQCLIYIFKQAEEEEEEEEQEEEVAVRIIIFISNP
jgi:hypothetical protein